MNKIRIFTIVFVALFSTIIAGSFARPLHPGKSPVEMMDTDANGAISKDEWTTFHEKMFKDMDKNGDGYLSDGELRPLHRK